MTTMHAHGIDAVIEQGANIFRSAATILTYVQPMDVIQSQVVTTTTSVVMTPKHAPKTLVTLFWDVSTR